MPSTSRAASAGVVRRRLSAPTAGALGGKSSEKTSSSGCCASGSALAEGVVEGVVDVEGFGVVPLLVAEAAKNCETVGEAVRELVGEELALATVLKLALALELKLALVTALELELAAALALTVHDGDDVGEGELVGEGVSEAVDVGETLATVVLDGDGVGVGEVDGETLAVGVGGGGDGAMAHSGCAPPTQDQLKSAAFLTIVAGAPTKPAAHENVYAPAPAVGAAGLTTVWAKAAASGGCDSASTSLAPSARL